MSNPTPQLTQIESEFKTIVWDPLISIYLPGYRVPVLGSILKLFTDAFYNFLCTLINVQAIEFENSTLNGIYQSSSENLALITKEKGVSSVEYQQALQTASNNFAKWVRM